jgi:hypothetical protein
VCKSLPRDYTKQSKDSMKRSSMRIRYVCLGYGILLQERPLLRCSMCLQHPVSRQDSYSGKTEYCSTQRHRWKHWRGRFLTSSQRRCLDIRFPLDVSCASLLFQHVALGLHLSLANFDDLVSKCSSDLFKSLVSCLTVVRVNT